MEKETTVEKYARQMPERHAILIDKNFYLVVKQKPNWMPGFLYRAVIKELVEAQEHRYFSLDKE